MQTKPNLEETLFEVIEQIATGNIPSGDHPDTVRLIGDVRFRYPRDEQVQQLCAWLENQSGALDELVNQVIHTLIQSPATEQVRHAA